jgi:hypothetical protein
MKLEKRSTSEENNNNSTIGAATASFLDIYDKLKNAGIPPDKLEEYRNTGFQLSREYPRLFVHTYSSHDEEFVRQATEGEPLIKQHIALLKELKNEIKE